MSNTILRLPAVKTRTGLSRSTIYLRASEGTFPQPVSLGARAKGWIESEVDAWLSQQIELSRRPMDSETANVPCNAPEVDDGFPIQVRSGRPIRQSGISRIAPVSRIGRVR
jgi:prophage regulatory protein